MTKVAAIQMCSSVSVAKNLEMAAIYLQLAALQGAKLAVLPEMFATFGMSDSDRSQVKETFGEGLLQSFLADQARTHQLWIVGGTIPLIGDDANKARAACLVFDAQGKLAGRYDKIHLFDADISAQESYRESNLIEPGTLPTLIQTPFGKLGVAVCYDIRFPELFRYLFNQGAEIFAVPAAFTVKTGTAHWQLLARSRAVENFCYFLGAAQGGEHPNGRKTYGHSLIVDPWGTVINEITGDSAGVILAEINLEYLHEIRIAMPVDKHQIFFNR